MPLILAILLAAGAETVSDTETWNEGVGYYEAGDTTNALRVLRPLMYSKGYAARAAEVVAKLEYEAGEREEAAAAAQIALRGNPGGGRENRNFTRATDGLAEYRKNRHIGEVLEKSRGKDAGDMLLNAAHEARKVFEEAGTYRTNEASRAVAMADSLAERAGALADVWIPVREAIALAVTNEEDAATILLQLEEARKTTEKAAGLLADFDGEAYDSMAMAESDFTRFLKLCIMPPAALDEDWAAQSNAWQDVETVNGRDWQREALDYTQAFRAKFPAWARMYEQQAESNTNMTSFAQEDQEKIEALAVRLEKLQLECIEKLLPPKQEEALTIIREMQGLMPKNRNGAGAQGEAGAEGEAKPEPQEGQEEGGEAEERQEEEAQEEGDHAQEELEALLKKAEERNEEHEADKKARSRKAPLPPNERDW